MGKLKRMLALISTVAMLSTLIVLPSTAFAEEAPWYAEGMTYIADYTTQVDPAYGLQRGEALEILYSVMGGDVPSEDIFSDYNSPASTYFYNMGVISGYGDTMTVGWNNQLLKGESAKILVNAIGHTYGLMAVDGCTAGFPDLADMGWAATEGTLGDPTASVADVAYCHEIWTGEGGVGGLSGMTNNALLATFATMIERYFGSDAVVVVPDPVVAAGGDLVLSLGEDVSGVTLPEFATSVTFMNIDVTAGDENGELESVVLTKHGVATIPAGMSLYLYDGADRLTSAKSVNSSTNQVSFVNLDIDVSKNSTKTLTLKGDVGNVSDVGDIGFKISGSDDVEVADGEGLLDGTVSSNLFGLSTTPVGTFTIEKTGTITNPLMGQQGVVMAKFKTSAATEDATIKTMAFLVTGTVSSSDLSDLEIWAVGGTEALATVDGLNSNDLAVFDFGDGVANLKGETKNYEMRGSLNTGRSGDDIKVYVDETTDVYAHGGTFGFGMRVVTTLYDGGSCTSAAGDCSYSEIEGGDITVTSNSPTSTDLAINGDNLTLMEMSIASVADVTVKSFPIILTTDSSASGDTGLMLAAGTANYTDIKVIDVDTGKTIMGPIDSTSMYQTNAYTTPIADGAATDADGFYLFTDEFELSAGEALNLAVLADIENVDGLDGETVFASLEFGATNPELRDSKNKVLSNAAVLVPASTMNGYTHTVKAPSLTLALAAVPVALSNTYVQGQDDVQFTGITANCATDTCKITDITVTGYLDDDGGANEFTAGAQGGSSLSSYVGSIWIENTAGEVVASAKSVNNTTGVVAFDNLSHELTGTEVWYIMGDISTNAFSDSDDVDTALEAEDISFAIANGGVSYLDISDNTRTSIGGAINGTTNPTTYVTTLEGGDLTVFVDDDTQKENILIAGVADQEVSKYLFTGTEESFTLKEISINARQSAITAGNLGDYDNNITSVTISYPTETGTATQSTSLTSGTAKFDNMSMYIAKDASAVLTVSATLNTISGGATAGEFVDLNLAFNNFEALAGSSGETYTGARLDATVAATSDLDFGTITFTDGDESVDLDGAQDVTVSLGGSTTLTIDANGGGDNTNTLPVGTVICVDDNGTNGVCTAEDIYIVTSVAIGATEDVYTVTMVDDAGDDDYADDAAILYALPGSGYLTGSNHMHVYETKPTLTLSDSSPSGTKTVSANDQVFIFDIAADPQEKIQIRTASELVTCVAGNGTVTLESAAETTAGLQVDGSSCNVDALGAANDFVAFAGTDFDSYSYVSFWVRWTDSAAGDSATLLLSEMQIGTNVGNASTADQTTTLSASNVLGSADAVTEDVWYHVYDVPMPTGTDSSDTFLDIIFVGANDAGPDNANDDVFIDRVVMYNDKITVDIASDSDFEADLDGDSNHEDQVPVAAYLKEGGGTVATGYIDVDSRDAAVTDSSTAIVHFYPISGTDATIGIAKGTSKEFTVQVDSGSLLNEDPGVDDPVTFSIDLGTSSGGTVSAGDLWWHDTNSAIQWLGKVENITENGNTLTY